MENDYRITKFHGTLIGDNRIPDLPVGEKTKVFSSTNGKTAWVDLPDGGIPIVEAEFSEELNSFILPTEQTTNFILHEESAGYFYINLIGGGAYSGFMTIPGTNIAYSLSGSGTMITLSTPVVLNIVSGTIGSDDTITIPSEQTGPFILSLELIGNIYVETYEAATTKYYGLSYRKDDEGDKLLILNGEGTTLTAKTFPLSGGGASVSPTLVLTDVSGDNPVYKTFLTEEEKTNIEKGLYNSVLYADASAGEAGGYSMYFPESMSTPVPGNTLFSTFDISIDETTGSFAITGASVFSMEIREKGEDGNYPINIQKAFSATFGGGSTSSSSFEEATLSQLSGFKGQYKALHITDCNVVFNFQEVGEITSNSVYFVGFVNSETQLEGTVWTIFGGNPVCLCTGTFYITNGVINGGHCTIGSLNSVSVGSLFTFGGTRSFNSKDATNAIGLYGVQGCEYAGKVDFVSNGATAKKSALTIISNVNKEATGESAFCEMDGLFEGYGLGRMVLKKDTNNIPQFKSFTTWLPPVTSADEGKSLVIKNGNAQWTSIPRYEHTVTLKTSAGAILWTQTMRNSSNTIVNSYTNLKTLFGEATYAGFGEYCQLDLRGGTEATDKLIKADGTEATLASLGAIVYTDVCFLPK